MLKNSCVILYILLLPLQAFSEEGIEQISSFPFIPATGMVYDIAVQGNYAYVLDDGFCAVNLSDPENPILLDKYYFATTDITEQVEVYEDYVLITYHHNSFFGDFNYSGLAILDISNPSNITRMEDNYILPWFDYDISDMTIYENYLYAASSSEGLIICCLDYLDEGLIINGHINLGLNDVKGIDVIDDVAYVVDEEEGLFLVDVSNPSIPNELSNIAISGNPIDVSVKENYAYVSVNDGIKVINVSDQQNPSLANSFESNGVPGEIEINGDFMYVPDGEAGLTVYSLVNPANPGELSNLPIRGISEHIAYINDDYILLVDGNSLKTISISNPSNPQLMNDFYGFNKIMKILKREDKLFYITDMPGRILISHIDNPSNYEEFQLPGITGTQQVFGGDILDNYLIVLCMDDFCILDISDTDNITLHSTIDNQLYGNNSMTFAHDDGIVYVGLNKLDDSDEGEIHIYDFSNPENPTLYSLGWLPGIVRAITAGDSCVFEHGYPASRILYVDASDLNNPHWDYYYDENPSEAFLFALGQDAFLSRISGNSENPIYKIQKLSSIQNRLELVDEVQVNHFGNILLQDSRLFLSGDYNAIYNIEDITSLSFTEIGQFYVGDDYITHAQAVFDNIWICVSDSVRIYDISVALDVPEPSKIIPDGFCITRSYPNPFNPSLNVEIALPQAGSLEVTVHNVLGQKVANLANQQYSVGTHTFSFDGSGLASGIYFVKASLPGQVTQMQKVVLMK